jgi:hypothetical protein
VVIEGRPAHLNESHLQQELGLSPEGRAPAHAGLFERPEANPPASSRCGDRVGTGSALFGLMGWIRQKRLKTQRDSKTSVAELGKICAAIRPRSLAKGSSITVDFMETGSYSFQYSGGNRTHLMWCSMHHPLRWPG